jgi:hypothetical protein
MIRHGLNTDPKAPPFVQPLCTDAQVTELGGKLHDLGKGDLAIVNSINTAPGGVARTLAGLGKALATIGATSAEFEGLDIGREAFSMVGVPGSSPGQAYWATDRLAEEADLKAGEVTPASVNSSIALDNNNLYAVAMMDYGQYDILPDGTIKITRSAEPDVYPVPAKPAGFKGGFHILALDRETLEPLPGSDELYSTNNDAHGQVEMAMELAHLSNEYGQSMLLLVASVGDPVGTVTGQFGPTPIPSNCKGSAAYTITCTYTSTGGEQSFKVPTAAQTGFPVTSLHVTAQGGRGGEAGSQEFRAAGGRTDQVTADLPVGSTDAVKPGQTLYVEVGGNGQDGGRTRSAKDGGWNGGASGGAGNKSGWAGGGGGGASDIRTVSPSDTGVTNLSVNSRLLIAAGGGGAAGNSGDGGPGGVGGAATTSGEAGSLGDHKDSTPGRGGGAGTATAGGQTDEGATTPGSLARGGDGRSPTTYSASGAGGGGGGGLYGGGGGDDASKSYGGGGGGGGGSDLVPAGGEVQRISALTPPTITISYTLALGTLGQLLRQFGGTPSVINQLNVNPRYALVGTLPTAEQLAEEVSPDSPEANTVIVQGGGTPDATEQATGELKGVLQRGQDDMEYGSITSDAPSTYEDQGKPQSTAPANYQLYDTIAYTTAPWPVPVAGAHHAVQQEIYEYLSMQACQCTDTDIRKQYNASPGILGDWLANLTAPANINFPAADFETVLKQLRIELADAKLVGGLKANMQTLLESATTASTGSLNSVFTDVKNSVQVPQESTAVPIIKFILEMASIAAEVAGFHAIAAVLGIITASLAVATELTRDDKGNGDDALQTTTAQLGQATVKQFEGALGSLQTTFSYVLGDWGKLQRVGTGLRGDEKNWDIGPHLAQLESAYAKSSELGFYRALVGVAYQRDEALGESTGDLSQWQIGVLHLTAAEAGYTIGSSAYTFPVATPELSFRPAHDNILISSEAEVQSNQRPLTTSLMTKMANIGLFAPYLFLRWSLDEGATCPSGMRYGGPNVDGLFSCYSVALAAQPLEIITSTLPAATVGQPYTTTLAAAGGAAGAHHWSLVEGSTPPAGITLSTTGVLSGTPTTAGHFPFTVSIDDPVTAQLTLTVNQGLASTGSPIIPLLVLALTLLVVGGALTISTRRGRRQRSSLPD